MRRRLMALAALCPAAAAAQPVFFDDFDGNALLPHWKQPDPWKWEHNVSGGMLNVTDLLYPNIPHLGGNFAIMGTSYAPQADFLIDVWMGWDPGDQPHRLAFHLIGAQGQIMATFAYRNEIGAGPDPVISASASNQGIKMPAPPPGIHHFTITRIGTQFDFFLNGDPFASFPDTFGIPAALLSFEFLGVGANPGIFGTLYVDRVIVIPTPGLGVFAAALALACARRRR